MRNRLSLYLQQEIASLEAKKTRYLQGTDKHTNAPHKLEAPNVDEARRLEVMIAAHQANQKLIQSLSASEIGILREFVNAVAYDAIGSAEKVENWCGKMMRQRSVFHESRDPFEPKTLVQMVDLANLALAAGRLVGSIRIATDPGGIVLHLERCGEVQSIKFENGKAINREHPETK